jgi:biotin carboxyl carrier protein
MDTERKQGYLNIDSSLYQTNISGKYEKKKKYEPVNPKLIISFIPGTVIELLVSPGKEVKAGDEVMIVDAMKMKNRIKCTIGGKVKSIPVMAGTRVTKGTVLLELE